jgi:hypothetical protein
MASSVPNVSLHTKIPTSQDVTSIQQTLNLFSVAIDTKQFHLLPAVFVPEAAFIIGSKTVGGLDQITAFLIKGLSQLNCQHALSTLHVNMIGPGHAITINMLQGYFFGKGDLTGEMYANHGYYEDELRQQPDGTWLIVKKALHDLVGLVFNIEPRYFFPQRLLVLAINRLIKNFFFDRVLLVIERWLLR